MVAGESVVFIVPDIICQALDHSQHTLLMDLMGALDYCPAWSMHSMRRRVVPTPP